MNSLSCFLWVLLSFSLLTSINAQNICSDTLEFKLNVNGNLFLETQNFELDTALYDSIALERNAFSCNDIGIGSVNAELFKNDVLQSSCPINLHILDTISPVVTMDQSIWKYIEVDDTLILEKSGLPLEYYDNCGIDTVFITPTQFTITHEPDSLVTITAIDLSGNSTTVPFRLDIDSVDCNELNFTCINNYRPNLIRGDVEVTASNLVDDRLMNCGFPYTITWFNRFGDTLQIPNNTLTQNEVGMILQAKVQNLTSGESCITQVIPENCLPIMESLIDWPEDITLNYSCLNNSIPDPEFLSPKIMEEELELNSRYYSISHDSVCRGTATIAYNYEDFFIVRDTVQKILRKWTLIEWHSGFTSDHIQLIVIKPGPIQFDTLECPGEINIHVSHQAFRVLKAEDVLKDNGILICDSIELSFLDKDLQPLSLPGNRIYPDFEHPYLYVVSNALNAEQSCTTKVNINIGPIYCWEQFYICDQLPYGQSFDNCDSNYTTSDNIEWPGDINVELCSDQLHDASPEYLRSQNGIAAKDAYPEVVLEGCIPIHVDLSYSDSFPNAGSQIFPQKILRTWLVEVNSVGDGPASNSWTYEQMITVQEVDTCDHIFQVRTGSGLPIPNVTIENGYVSGQNGTIDLENYPHDSIHPVYTGTSMVSDISIEDLRLLNKAIDNDIYLTAVQRIAADANFDGQIDEEDLDALYNYIFDGIPLQKNWVFVNLDSAGMQMDGHFQVAPYNEKSIYDSAENAYEYLGVRIGDVDLSVFKQKEEVGDTLTLQVENESLIKNNSISIPVSIVEDVPLVSLQFSLHFDPDYLRFIGLGSIENNINNGNFNLLNDSILLFSWNEENFQAVVRGELEQALLSPFLDLNFIVKEDGSLCDRIRLDTAPLAIEAVYYNDQYDITTATLKLDCEGQVTNSSYPKTVEFSIYPNPVEDQIYIQWENNSFGSNYTYKILNSHGSVLLINQEAQQLNTISVRDIPAGVYWLEIMEDGKAAAVKKFVVQ